MDCYVPLDIVIRPAFGMDVVRNGLRSTPAQGEDIVMRRSGQDGEPGIGHPDLSHSFDFKTSFDPSYTMYLTPSIF